MLRVNQPWDEPCSDCGSHAKVIDRKAGDLLCKDCGLVLEQHMLDETPEHRSFADDNGSKADPSRVGCPATLLRCDIDTSTQLGKMLAKTQSRVMSGALAHDGKRMPSHGVTAVINEYKDLVIKMNIVDHVRRCADEMFTVVIGNKNLIGDNRKAAYAACMFYAGKNAERIISAEEIRVAFGINRHFAKICNIVSATLRSSPEWPDFAFIDKKLTGADVVARMVKCQLKIPCDMIAKVTLQCDKIWAVLNKDSLLAGKNTHGANVAVIMHACTLLGVDVSSDDIVASCKLAQFMVCQHEYNDTFATVKSAIAKMKTTKDLKRPMIADMRSRSRESSRESEMKSSRESEIKATRESEFTFPSFKATREAEFTFPTLL